MTIKIALASATAMGLLMGGAWAGSNNDSALDQNGDRNSAVVTQAGDNNDAGVDTPGRRMRQDGTDNVLLIDQQSNEAFGSVRGGQAGTNYGGIDQVGAFNRLEIIQNAGSVLEVQQVSTGAAPAASSTTNEAIVVQDKSASNIVERIGQTFIGSGAKNLVDIDQSTTANGTTGNGIEMVTQSGTGNTVVIDQRVQWNKVRTIQQDGMGNIFTVDQEHQFVGGIGGNEISLGDQRGNANEATVIQAGAGNKVDRVSQDNTGSAAGPNIARLDLNGADNGQLGLGTISGPDYAASAAGAFDKSVVQLGGANAVDLEVVGDRNQFGFNQVGDSNIASNLVLTGNENELGINQAGDNNIVDLGVITGNRNDVGVRQLDDGNIATIDISDVDDSDDNDVRVVQDSQLGVAWANEATVGISGDDNLVDVNQALRSEATVDIDGDGNDVYANQYHSATATATIDGDNNFLSFVQSVGATATVSINGSDNNRGSFQGGITSVLASNTTSVLGAPMAVGNIYQNGSSTTDVTVGSLGASDGNLFATNQSGNGNTIVGMIDGFGQNEAVVTQAGMSNVASFNQNGGMNLVAISQ